MGSLIDSINQVADDLTPSESEQRRFVAGEAVERIVTRAQLQTEQFFVAGWRPFIGWIGALGLAYQFLLYPILLWLWASFQGAGWVPGDLQPPPPLDADKLWVMLTGTLGIAGMRSFDKLKGTQTLQVGKIK